MGARRVEGSGDDMKIYAGEGDDSIVLDLGNQQDLNAFAGLYQQVVGPQDVATSAYEQGAPVDLEKLWNDIYGPGIPFPDTSAVDEFGRPIINQQTNQIVPDIQKYNQVIDALEARVGSLSRYGLDRDADYQLIDLGDQYESDIVISGGKVTKINKTTGAQSPEVSAGRLREDIGVQMPGYDVLEQRTGELSAIQQRVDPGYIIDPKTMQPYFQQPDGSLQAAPTPSVDDQISMHLVEGNMDAAVSKANFRDRPTSLEYFNAAMDWARTPADIFTISAIVRGVFEPTPGPMGELRRVGAPPAWATQAWVGLQNSMGIPAESMTATPNGEPGSVNPMMVSASSGLVSNNFVSPNSAPVTLDGKTVVQPATANITPDTTVQALDDSGNVVGTMTAEMATSQGFNFSGSDQFAAAVPPTAPGVTPTPIPKVTPTPIPGAKVPPVIPAVTGVAGLGKVFSLEELQAAVNSGTISSELFREMPGMPGYFITKETLDGLEAGSISIEDLESQIAPPSAAPAAPAASGNIRTIYGPGGVSMEIDLSTTNLMDWQNAGWSFDPDDVGDISSAEELPEDLPPIDQLDILEGRTVGYTAGGTPFSPRHEALAESMGISIEEFFGEGEQDVAPSMDYGGGDEFLQASGPARSFEEILAASQARDEPISSGLDRDLAIAAQVGQYAIDPLEEGGWGTEEDIYRDWRSNMFDVPGEGTLSRGQLNDPAYWEQVASEYMTDPVNARIMEEVRNRQAEIDYATNYPFGQYLSEYPYTRIPGTEPELPASDLTPASWTVFPRPKEAGSIDQTYGIAPVSGVEMRARNLGELDVIPEVAPPMPVPTPTPQPSEIKPFERARAVEAYDPQPFVYDDFEYYDDEPDEEPDEEIFEEPVFEPEPVFEVAPVFEPEPVEVFEPPEDWGWSGEDFMDTGASEEAYWSGYDEGAKGTRTGDRFTLVGEEGPELALFPRGTEIVPLNRPAKPKQRRRLRNNFADAIDSFAFGGFSNGGPALVGEMGPELVDLPPGAQVMPAGITEMMTGRPTRAPRSLFRQAGMRAPSAQTIGNLLPEEIEVYQEMGRLAGIPEKAFEREFRSMVPMGQGGTRQARFTPRGTGRTRYGSI